mgnify:CR=1 FL=1
MAKTMKQKFYSILHRLLIKKSYYRNRNILYQKIWQSLWDFSINSYKGIIDYKLHGESVKINNGNPYPLFINTFYDYNFPLIEVVYQVFEKKNCQIDYVDIVSAIGDSLLLLFHKCQIMVGFNYCMNGVDEFF